IDSQRKIFTEITQKQVVLDDPTNAAQKIHEALEAARLLARPVYIEIPRDLVFEPIRIPSHFRPTAPGSDKEAAGEAAEEIGILLSRSRRPVLMIGIEVPCFHFRS